MRLVVYSHKPCWKSEASPSGYATDGGFPMQMRALSELFDSTVVAAPCGEPKSRVGEMPLVGRNLSFTPLSMPRGTDGRRKLDMPWWLLRNCRVLWRELRRADAVHAPIPGDVGTIGMLMAFLSRRPLFVRYCGNWLIKRTMAEGFWQWFMERFAGGRNVMLATGGAAEPPSHRNAEVRWVFATSLTEQELQECGTARRLTEGKARRLIIACRQEGGKGTDQVIESLPSLRGEFPKLILDVVGDGSALPKLKQLADSRGVTGQVCFHGKVTHERVLELLRLSDVFCFPTASEGFPKAVLEALACGLPVVTTKVSVLPQLIGNGCGVLIDEVTPTAIARAVRSCLGDRERYAEMSERAVATAKEYSIERWRDSIGALLEKAWGPLDNHG